MDKKRAERSADVEVGVPYLINRGDGVDGHYCIGRKTSKDYHEFWNHNAQVWCSVGTLFELNKLPITK